MDCSLPGCSVHGISQSRILEWVIISFSRESSWPRDQTRISCIGRQILCHWATWEAWKLDAAAAKSLQSCPTLCDPIDGSPLGSAVPGILQPRILEWVAIPFSNAWKWKVKEYWSGVPLPSPICRYRYIYILGIVYLFSGKKDMERGKTTSSATSISLHLIGHKQVTWSLLVKGGC